MPRLTALRAPLIPHPISDRAYWERIASDPVHAVWRNPLLARASALAEHPPVVHASDLVAGRRDNDRRRSDRLLGELRQGVSTLTMRRCLLGPAARDDQLLDWLWAQLHLAHWAMISHLPNQDLPRYGQPHLDLGACMTALVLSESCELLRPWLDAQSATLADSILDRIDADILLPFADGWNNATWCDLKTVHNNWTGVCAGAILAICSSFARQGRPRPQAHARTLPLLARYLHAGFTPAGECDEGPGYWDYGLIYACAGLAGLNETERAAAIDLPRLRAVASYPERAHLFGDTFYASNDAGAIFQPDLQLTGWLAAVNDDAFLHAWTAARGRIIAGHMGLCWRAPLVIDAIAAEPVPAWPPPARPVVWLVDQHAAIFRRNVGSADWLASLAGGHNGEAHNHNDVGHVNLWVDGEEVLIDLGCPVYTTDIFGPRRYTYLATASLGHNVPVIASHAQASGGEAAARMLAGPDAQSGFTLDLAAAYPREAGCTCWERHLALDGHGLTIADRAQLTPGTPVEVRFWTREPPALFATGVNIGAVLLRAAGAEITVQQESAAAHHVAGETLWCVCLRATADATGALSVVTRIEPG